MSKAHRQELDENRAAFHTIQSLLERSERTERSKDRAEGKNPAAVVLGRLGGLKGGKARAEKLTKKQRSESASQAATVRWKQYRERQK